MATSDEGATLERDPKLWLVTAAKWVLDNPDYTYAISLGLKLEAPPQEIERTSELETLEAPDLETAIAAAHALLDKHARKAADLGLDIWLMPPKLPYPEQERLGVRHYKLGKEARRQARTAGIRGRDLEARVAGMVRHGAPFDHAIANLRFRGLIMRVEDDIVTWIGLAVPPRRRRASSRRNPGKPSIPAGFVSPPGLLLSAC
jgi:hypothetical protein